MGRKVRDKSFCIETRLFPFDLFGSSGSGEGAKLLYDAIQELILDIQEEEETCRSNSLQSKIVLEEKELNTLEELSQWRKDGQELFRLIDPGHKVLWLSGNHLGFLPVLDCLPPNCLVLQLDAHLDIQKFADNLPTLSHGNFLLHRSKSSAKIIHLGGRDLFHTPEQIKQQFELYLPMEDWDIVEKKLKPYIDQAERIWIDLDCDVFDPFHFPAVVEESPLGLLPSQFNTLMKNIPANKCIGWSISEFMPTKDFQDRSLHTLMWLIERQFLRWTEFST